MIDHGELSRFHSRKGFMKEWDTAKLVFCSWPGNRMLLLELSKEVTVIKLSAGRVNGAGCGRD